MHPRSRPAIRRHRKRVKVQRCTGGSSPAPGPSFPEEEGFPPPRPPQHPRRQRCECSMHCCAAPSPAEDSPRPPVRWNVSIRPGSRFPRRRDVAVCRMRPRLRPPGKRSFEGLMVGTATEPPGPASFGVKRSLWSIKVDARSIMLRPTLRMLGYDGPHNICATGRSSIWETS